MLPFGRIKTILGSTGKEWEWQYAGSVKLKAGDAILGFMAGADWMMDRTGGHRTA